MKTLDTYTPDKSGINSLGGFAYQIKVFVLYMLSMDENMQAGFETVDDVSIKKITPETVDDNEDKFKNLIVSSKGTKVIQVKRTAITEIVAKQVLYNWILLEGSNKRITDYILFTDGSYENKDIVFSVSAEDLYLEVLNTKKIQKATIAKVKKKYEEDKQGFIDVYNAVKKKYSFVSVDKIDDEIDEKCKILFKKAGINAIIYYSRIKELLKHITFEIIKKINEKAPYVISYEEMMAYSEDICNRFTNQYMYPSYSEFKKLNRIDFLDLNRVKRKTSKKKFAKKCREINQLMGHMKTWKLKEITAKLNQILTGYYHYYGITDNTERITAFRYHVMKSLFYCLNRRSQKKSYNWVEFLNMIDNSYPLVRPRIYVSVYN